jgi:GNAT superfamily N-acetyltransferase
MTAAELPAFRSLVFATDVDVLAANRQVARRDGYWRVASPGNPTFWWGNFLLFDRPPVTGDAERWSQLFDHEFSGVAEIAHRAFGWDSPDGEPGAVASEFPRPWVVERSTGLIASAGAIARHPRANPDVTVRALDPRPGADARLWDAVLALQLEQMRAEPWEADLDEAYTVGYRRRRNEELREIFRAGRGAWYVALMNGEVAGSLGIVVTDGRARYQAVDTAARFRGRGVATRLVVEAAELAAREHHIEQYVIVADPDYHAIGIYESVGFRPAQTAVGVMLTPSA